MKTAPSATTNDHGSSWTFGRRKRWLVLVSVGAVVLGCAYFVFVTGAGRDQSVPIAGPETRLLTVFARVPAGDGTAAVLLWSYANAREKAHWGAKKATRLVVSENRTQAANEVIPNDQIRAYLDARVLKGEIEYVIVTMRETSMSVSLAVLEQCRKSRVSIVIIEQPAPE